MDILKQQGLLFVYLFGINDEETGIIKFQQVNSLNYGLQEFEGQIISIKIR